MTTSDCPICLCPITSEVWGVVNPCGHPYHRDCWKEVVANHHSHGRGSGSVKCAICKGPTKGFVPVFVDLVACDDNSNYDGGEKLQQDADNDSDEQDDDDDEFADASLTELRDEFVETSCTLYSYLDEHGDQGAADLLDRLGTLHRKIYERLAGSGSRKSSSSSSVLMQLERMRAKAKELQSINTELQTSNEELLSSNATLQRSSIDAAVDKERTLVKYKKLQSQFNAMGRSYEEHVAKTELDKQLLQAKISQLQTEYAKLVSKSNINELHEMESIRIKYTKMSQEVHDLKAKNRKLESNISRCNRDWEVKYEKEKLRYNALAKEMKQVSSHYYQLVGDDDDDGDVSRSRSNLGNTQSGGSTANKTFISDLSRGATNKHNIRSNNNNNNGGTTSAVSHRQDVIDAQIRRDSIGQPNPFNLLQKKNGLPAANIMTSGRKKTNNNNGEGYVNNSRGRKAMEALDKSTVRKKQQQQVHGLKQPHTLLQPDNRHLTTTQSSRLSHDGISYSEEREDNNEKHHMAQLHHDNDDDDDQLQLMIKPRLSNNKRKHGIISSSSNNVTNYDTKQEEPPAAAAAAVSSSRSVAATSASYSPRKKKGSITTYFNKNNNKGKPLLPLAERSYPSYQPHIFFGSDLATLIN